MSNNEEDFDVYAVPYKRPKVGKDEKWSKEMISLFEFIGIKLHNKIDGFRVEKKFLDPDAGDNVKQPTDNWVISYEFGRRHFVTIIQNVQVSFPPKDGELEILIQSEQTPTTSAEKKEIDTYNRLLAKKKELYFPTYEQIKADNLHAKIY